MSTDYLTRMADPEMTREDAVALGETGWWKLYPHRDVALAQLRQERLCMPFGDFRRIVEEAIGGGVWTHEFARPASLIERIEGGQRGPGAGHRARYVSPMQIDTDTLVDALMAEDPREPWVPNPWTCGGRAWGFAPCVVPVSKRRKARRAGQGH